jgi:hypothetical protein
MQYDSIGKSWYENGQLKTDSTGADLLCWDKDGILVRRNDTWFYKNGQKINEELADGTIQLFTSGGELAAKKQKLTDKEYYPTTGTYHEHIRYYYDRVLRDAIDELFTKPYPEFNYGPDQILWLFGWVGAVYSENIKEGRLLLNHLSHHPEEKTRRHAEYLLSLATKKENGNTEITYWLESDPFTVII